MRDPKGACVDEKDCAFERATVCAFDGQPVATRAAFLDCLDDFEKDACNDGFVIVAESQ